MLGTPGASGSTVASADRPGSTRAPESSGRGRRTTVVAVAATVVRRPLPDDSGALVLPGLTAEVTVLRDARGVPSIYADNAEDLFRAQGFVHAQDRFFEMDYRRHVTSGRLSELVGQNADALAADKVIRTFG